MFLNWQTSSKLGYFLTLFLETSQQILLNLFLSVPNLTKLRIMSARQQKSSKELKKRPKDTSGKGKNYVVIHVLPLMKYHWSPKWSKPQHNVCRAANTKFHTPKRSNNYTEDFLLFWNSILGLIQPLCSLKEESATA